jgi:hypothetical protein
MFKGKGMPILNNDPLSPLVPLKTRGNFILKFDICFPQQMSSAAKEELCAVLDE